MIFRCERTEQMESASPGAAARENCGGKEKVSRAVSAGESTACTCCIKVKIYMMNKIWHQWTFAELVEERGCWNQLRVEGVSRIRGRHPNRVCQESFGIATSGQSEVAPLVFWTSFPNDFVTCSRHTNLLRVDFDFDHFSVPLIIDHSKNVFWCDEQNREHARRGVRC